MKTLLMLVFVFSVIVSVRGIIDDPADPFQVALEEFLAHPDFALMSETWELDTDTWKWEVRVCAIPVYFAGPLALEDRSDCGLPWAVVAR